MEGACPSIHQLRVFAMLGAKRGFVLGIIVAAGCIAAGVGGWLPHPVAGESLLDTSRLPRVAGAKQTYASQAATIYIAPSSVAQTTESVAKILDSSGWLQYAPPFAQQIKNENLQVMTFKKGPQGLSVLITVAPAQNNATSVNYTALALANDLPFPSDATGIEFDPNRPHLNCLTAAPIEKTLEFFRKELGSRGWSIWSAKDGAKSASGYVGETTEKGAYAYYIRKDQRPLLLLIQHGEAGRNKVELKAVPAEALIAESKRRETKNPSAAASKMDAAAATIATAHPSVEKSPPSAEADASAEIVKQARQMANDAISESAIASETPKGSSNDSLGARAQGPAPIPLPSDAEEVDFDGADGKLEFNSESNVKTVAVFYRKAMKPLGWREQPSPINRQNMAVLNFSKGDKEISLTIMQMGNKTNVVANGAGLVTAADKPDADGAESSDSGAKALAQDLEAEETAGFPVPKRHTMSSGESSPFRRELTASVPLDLRVVLDFYRRELGKRAWKEEAEGAVVESDRATISFTTPDGPAVLKLGRKNAETTVSLALRDRAAAEKAGVAPKPGQAKLLFGNVLGTDAMVTINKKTIKVGAGVGAKAPNGPTLDLPPGKHKCAFKVAGKPAQSEELELSAGETWGLLIGPGGALTMHVY
jgi:hypothetical protein